MAQRAELLLRKAASLNMHTRAQCLAYLGSHFRIALDVPTAATDHQASRQSGTLHVITVSADHPLCIAVSTS